MKSKPVQIAIIVIGLLVGVIGIFLAMKNSGTPQTATSVMLVDVKSGELFEAGTKSRTLVLPEKNPETGERTLMRVGHEDDRDGLFISTRHLEMLNTIEGDLIKIDMSSGRVDIDENQKPKKLP